MDREDIRSLFHEARSVLQMENEEEVPLMREKESIGNWYVKRTLYQIRNSNSVKKTHGKGKECTILKPCEERERVIKFLEVILK